jgi:hypothetical protein
VEISMAGEGASDAAAAGTRLFHAGDGQPDAASPELLEAVTLLFSGGLDSAAAAILLSEQFRTVHLLTFRNGHGHIMASRARGPAQDLMDAKPGRFQHRVSSVAPLFRQLVTEDLRGNYREYGSRFVWCFGCKLAMHSETILYCLRHGITHAGDGSSRETRYYVEQSPLGLELIDSLYSDYGIGFATPVHRLATREEAQRLLIDHGVRQGIRFRHRNPGTQPLCLPGNAIYLLSTVFSIHPEFPQDQVRRFFEDKAEQCRRYIDAGLAEVG